MPIEIKLKHKRLGMVLFSDRGLFFRVLGRGRMRPDMHRMNFEHHTNPAREIHSGDVFLPLAILFILWMIEMALVHLAG